jgi:hypothetical protein
VDDFSEVLARLETRLDTLEGRVLSLEHPDAPAALPVPGYTPPQIAAAPTPESTSFSDAGATFPVVGKAMLGMAGAYLLRAVAESGSFPKLAVVALAIAYAAMWLVSAARLPARAWFASTTYAATSALILAPMLGELTLRFHFLPPTSAAAVLAAFVLAAYALAWKRDLTPIVWVAALTSTFAAIPLLIATHDMVPFVCVLLLTAIVTEIASARNRWLSVRPVVAIAADIGVWALIYIYASPGVDHSLYANLTPALLLAPCLILLLTYGTSVALRTTVLGQRITLFETAQAVIAFLLAAQAILHFGPATSPVAFGIFCLLLSPACYAAVFLCFDRPADSRNYTVYATWSLALFLAGSFLCLPVLWLASALGVAAILATLIGTRRSCLSLAFHGLIYLTAAAFASGLLSYASHALAGTFPQPPLQLAWIIAGTAILCYTIISQTQPGTWKQKLFQILAALLAVGAAATILISSLIWLTAHLITPGESHVAVIRTLAACALALALAYFGPRWQRTELLWITYGTLALVAAKLLIEDLSQGRPEFIAASIFFYAVTLILVPQLAHRSLKNTERPFSGNEKPSL